MARCAGVVQPMPPQRAAKKPGAEIPPGPQESRPNAFLLCCTACRYLMYCAAPRALQGRIADSNAVRRGREIGSRQGPGVQQSRKMFGLFHGPECRRPYHEEVPFPAFCAQF